MHQIRFRLRLCPCSTGELIALPQIPELKDKRRRKGKEKENSLDLFPQEIFSYVSAKKNHDLIRKKASASQGLRIPDLADPLTSPLPLT